MTDYMCIVHLKDQPVYLIDRKAFYLLCSLQQVKFERDNEKLLMYTLTLEWLQTMGRAIKLEKPPTHLIIEFEDEK